MGPGAGAGARAGLRAGVVTGTSGGGEQGRNISKGHSAMGDRRQWEEEGEAKNTTRREAKQMIFAMYSDSVRAAYVVFVSVCRASDSLLYNCAQQLQALGIFPQSSPKGEITKRAAQSMQQRAMAYGLSLGLPPLEALINIAEKFSFAFVQQARA